MVVIGEDDRGLREEDVGLATVCRSALKALGARRITVWRTDEPTATVSPWLTVTAAWSALEGASALDDHVLDDWASTPTGELPPFLRALEGGRTVVVADPSGQGGRFEELASDTGLTSATCEPLDGDVPAGLLVIEPAQENALFGVIRVLVASASSWLSAGPVWEPSPEDAERSLADELADVAPELDPVDLLHLVCRRLVKAVGARRACIFAEDEPGHVRLRMAETASGPLDDETWTRMCETEDSLLLVGSVLSSGLPERTGDPERIGPTWADSFDVASAMAVPIGERAVLVLDDDRVSQFDQDAVAIVVAAADQLRVAAINLRRRRERFEHDATATALRQLLETGVRACSPMEAAGAIAAAATSVLGLPTACTYLVDPSGLISEVATVGAAPGLAEELRATLVGKRAADSPVWRRTVEGVEVGPDLIPDTSVSGVVRAGGVAEVLNLRSLATIPLLSSDGPLGLVLCGDTVPRRRWRQGDREMLEQLALEGAVVVDNARLREAERHEAAHDPLTGLLNRRAFAEQFRVALAVAQEEGRTLAVLVVDLDRFKEINDHLGHHCGDELLVEVACRLRRALRDGDILARMGGDEFAVVLAGDDGQGVENLIERMRRALVAPVGIGSKTLRVEASIGAAFFPEQGEDVDGLLQRADLAMYAAKRSARREEAYLAGIHSHTELELGLLGDLRQAIRGNRELVLHYQPKLHLGTGDVVGVEALIRWDHPRYGMLGADCFVPLAEDSGLMSALTAWVVPTALRQVQIWRDRKVNLRVSVNISAHDVADPQLVDKFAGWLRFAGLPGTCLVVEVTEGALLQEGAQTLVGLQGLRALGIEVSLDDFGTGYSSLAYLESLPVDEIKIDRRFLCTDIGERRVLRAIIDLGHDLGKRVVAEGVESVEHTAWLTGAGCDEAQGYLFSRPVDSATLLGWLADRVQAGRAPARSGAAAGTGLRV